MSGEALNQGREPDRLSRTNGVATRFWTQCSPNMRLKQCWRAIQKIDLPGLAARTAPQSLISRAQHCGLDPVKALGKTFRQHLPGILNSYRQQFLESINSQLQAASFRVRGYPDVTNMLIVIDLLVGKLTPRPYVPALSFSKIRYEQK
jgi:hypothetical protein